MQDTTSSGTAGNKGSDPTSGASSFGVAQGGTPMTDSLFIRGVGALVTSMGVESDVAASVDGIVMMRGLERTMQSYANYPDLDHGEVLYGPQGSTFSRNAVGGAINIVTLAPTEERTAHFALSMADAGEYHEKGTISGSLSDTVTARLSAFNNNVPGWIHNVALHKNASYTNSWGVSGKVKWDASDRLNLMLSGDYRNIHSDCCQSTFVKIEDATLAQLYLPAKATKANRDVTRNAWNGYANKKMFFALTGNYNLGFANVRSITAFQKSIYDSNTDLDALNTPEPIYVGGGTSGSNWASGDYAPKRYRLQQLSEDIKLTSNPTRDSRLSYMGGIYLYHYNLSEKAAQRRSYCSEGTLGEACDEEYLTYQSRQIFSSEYVYSAAIYGEVNYKLTDHLIGFGGPRLQYERIQVGGRCTTPMTAYSTDEAYSGSCGDGVQHTSDVALSGDVGLRYMFENGSAYTRLSHGYKGKGFNMGFGVDFGTQKAVDPETDNALEFGLSLHSPDGRFTFNGDIYQTNYDNIQVSVKRQNTSTGLSDAVVMAAGTARTRGVEASMTQKLFKGFSMHEGIIFTEAAVNLTGIGCPVPYQSDVTASYASSSAAPSSGCYTIDGSSTVYQNVHKGVMPHSPKWKISVAPRYTHGIPRTNYNGFVQLSANYTSGQYFDIRQDKDLYQKAYTVVNGTVGVTDKSHKYKLTFSVNNIFNQLYYVNLNRINNRLSTSSYNNYAATIPKNAFRNFKIALTANF